jgi:uncharacterized protein (DUF1697 family)
MPTAIALIRGINVGGRNTLPMAELRKLCEGLGFEDTRTYIQSGNVVFRAAKRELSKAPAALEDAIESRRGFRPTVVVRTADQWRGVIAANPFAGRRGIDKSRLIVMCLAREPAATASAVEELSNGQDEARLVGREVFLHFPKGRNWNTAEKLMVMAGETGD